MKTRIIVQMTPIAILFLLGLAATLNARAGEPAAGPRPFSLTPQQKTRLLQALEEPDKLYDAREKMLRRPFSSPGYHTTLKGGMVHPTRDSLGYAVALLDTGEPPRIERAAEILRRVIALQDQNPDSKTYGIWSWYLEEPLSQMSPPDWNWADFCGVQLLQVALDHRDRLPAALMAQVDVSIRHAARSIQKRNIGPGYTNIAIMGTYVTLVAAELYRLDDLKAYAMARLKNLYDYTLDLQGFNEYNSPTYTIVALSELGRMRLHVRDVAARKMVEELYRIAWEEVAAHFHAPSRQWAGPHSRCYSTLLGESALGLIERATAGRAAFGLSQGQPALAEARLPLPCPPGLEHSFIALDQPRSVIKTYVKSDPPVVGTTWLAPRFALGTVNRGDLWNQRRNLLAYWGTPERPSYLHLRFLKDGYDLAAAHSFIAQCEGRALAAVGFATDGGDTHISLTRLKAGVLRAKDLRLRFELGGEAGKARPVAPKTLAGPARLRFGDLAVDLSVPYARFGETQGRWEAGLDEEKEIAFLDVVFYSGAEKEFRLDGLNAAALGLAVQLGDAGAAAPVVECASQDGMLALRWEGMHVEMPLRPVSKKELMKSARSDQ